MTSSWKPHYSIRYKGSHEPGAYTNRNCIPKKSRTLMTMTSKFHPWFRRKSILTRHLNTLRGLRYHGLDMRVRCVTWTTLCHNNVSFWLLTSTKLLMIAHILGSLQIWFLNGEIWSISLICVTATQSVYTITMKEFSVLTNTGCFPTIPFHIMTQELIFRKSEWPFVPYFWAWVECVCVCVTYRQT